MNRPRLLIGLFLLANLLPFWPLNAQSKIQQAVNTLARDIVLKHGSLGVCVVDVESGQVIASHNAELSLIPASSLKVVTTATALGVLGPDYRFTTDLQYDGTLDASGNLNGNLYLKGTGDPTLGSDQMAETPGFEEILKQFSGAVRKKGILKVNGNIVGDASSFGTAVNGRTWQWNDMGNYYGAGAWGLNMHENLYYLHFQQSTRLGATPRIANIEPEIKGISFHNEVTTAGARTGDNAYIYGAPYTYERFVRGTIPAGSGQFTIKGSIPDPPLFAAYHLQQSLQDAGIASSGKVTTNLEFEKSGSRKTLFTHQSPTLGKIVARANMKSVNLYCESLIRAIGRKNKNQGTTEAGIEALETYWSERGLPMPGCTIDDGSGLSPRNVVTPAFMAKMMGKVARDKKIFTPFYNSLPVAGHSGSLANRLKGTAAEGKVSAKSGTLRSVRSYTGYAKSRSGKLMAFCLIANNYSCSGSTIRNKLEEIMLSMCQ